MSNLYSASYSLFPALDRTLTGLTFNFDINVTFHIPNLESDLIKLQVELKLRLILIVIPPLIAFLKEIITIILWTA